jgi:flagellar biosynthetic protein FlhB
MERKLLARTLYANVEVGREIPYELYSAVAEVLAYVFKLKGKNPLKKRKPSEESRV